MLRYAVSCFLLLLLTAQVNGAEPDAGNEPAAEPDAESAPAPEDIDAALAEEIRAAEEAAASETADADDSFVPSVQISEDLSVSFPVDI